METKRHLAFDFGAESGRAVVGTLKDGKLTMEELHRFPTQSMFIYGSLRWNIYRFYEEIVTGLRKYTAKYGSALESIGVDTWGVDYGFLKGDGTLLEIPYQYRDDRTNGTAEIIDKAMGNRAVYDITGIQFMTINTLNQMVAVKRDTPERFDEAHDMLFIGDILHYLLGGKKTAEFTVASTSQMLDAFQKDWSPGLLRKFGFPDKLKSRIVFAGDVLGTINTELAKEVGLSETVKIVTPAVHDTASAAAAIPAEGEKWAYISSGTWCMVGVETGEPVINDASYEMNISNSGGALGKNLFLKNVMGLWIIQQCKKAWNKKYPELGYPGIVEKAVNAKPFAGFIDPDDALFFAPQDNIAAIREYLDKTGQTGVDTGDIGTVARIVYESLAFKYRYVVDRLKAATGQEVEVLHIIGGGTKNALLNQFSANALGFRVKAGPAEATATGNLLLQAYGCGEVGSLQEIREIVRASNEMEVFEPERETAGEWTRAYEQFKTVCGL
ncbi:rhamnulokinase [Christensenella intestinihominis]|uniref:rhamnulokinase n=1 Tax=Christensenella intestinihominis TaxID=1851429 RepID=UPI00082D019A|nr:rhamnulokinase family protein [Christensenella intestinihominis]